MNFVAEKDPGVIPTVLAQILDSCVNGVTLSDPDLPDNPIIYANDVFVQMTGYSRDEIVGRNCRFLQGEDRDQPAIDEIRAALAEHRSVEVTLRNYRKDGSLFHNRLSIRPLLDPEGQVIYYLGVQYDVTDQIQAQQEIERLTNLLGQA
ncbi:MAG TPA: PAS sensor domain-containing protein [Chromatiaceae bacterium]|nr:MAG: PAS sensor protein [Thiohalocapsa sp. PB-PSB1]QQO57779.1 MAG: PAS sensor domain-containing protein [Thiohalocapsa sp. PB-PSB1]HBG94735.1 PAS sensor domain-containing protein [Chromatiaceae bacterium]HCS90122.1 PAS sensor domain-containing protein [Chromatiaceae bacterium]